MTTLFLHVGGCGSTLAVGGARWEVPWVEELWSAYPYIFLGYVILPTTTSTSLKFFQLSGMSDLFVPCLYHTPINSRDCLLSCFLDVSVAFLNRLVLFLSLRKIRFNVRFNLNQGITVTVLKRRGDVCDHGTKISGWCAEIIILVMMVMMTIPEIEATPVVMVGPHVNISPSEFLVRIFSFILDSVPFPFRCCFDDVIGSPCRLLLNDAEEIKRGRAWSAGWSTMSPRTRHHVLLGQLWPLHACQVSKTLISSFFHL